MSRFHPSLAALALIGCSGGMETPAAGNGGEQAAQGTASPEASATPLPPANTTGGSPESAAVQDPADDARYAGRWVGVEGMFFDVKPLGGGRYEIDMQYDLDRRAKVVGYSTGAGLAFPREGELLVAKPSDGDATGLKYLAGKPTCLTVKPGEGYCRA